MIRLREVKVSFWICQIAMLIGGVIVALPDDGPRQLQINNMHGPAMLDTVGLFVILSGYLPMAVLAVVRRKTVLQMLGCSLVIFHLAFVVVSFLALAILLGIPGYWWVVAAACAYFGQTGIFLAAFAKKTLPDVL